GVRGVVGRGGGGWRRVPRGGAGVGAGRGGGGGRRVGGVPGGGGGRGRPVDADPAVPQVRVGRRVAAVVRLRDVHVDVARPVIRAVAVERGVVDPVALPEGPRIGPAVAVPVVGILTPGVRPLRQRGEGRDGQHARH